MKLAEIVATSRDVAATRSRLAKAERLAACLRRLPPEEVDAGVAFLSGDLPRGRVGLGPAAVRAARATPPADSPALEVRDVDRAFERIRMAAGPGSTGERARLLAELLRRAGADEQEFLAALAIGELRQGALEGIMAEAVARAADLPVDHVRRAAMLSGDVKEVARAVLKDGAVGLLRFRLELMRPLLPMLAQPAGDVGSALLRLQEGAFEYKLDGARVQVHKSEDRVRVFSRRQNDVTAAVPEVVERVLALPARALVLDGEVLALREDGTPHPFQVTMSRFGRRKDVADGRAALPLSPYFFDVLHVDGDDLIDRPGAERVAVLADRLPDDLRMPRRVTADPAVAAAFLEEALARGHEGVMAKSLAAPYEAGSRGWSWLKIKPAHTLDLVVLAAEWGSGRRRGRLSNLHLGARGEHGFVMLGKTFKGMTDAMLAWQTERLLTLEVARQGHVVLVRPELVVEVAFNDVQASPHYPAGMALRFARVKRYREDKVAAEADSIDEVRRIFERGA